VARVALLAEAESHHPRMELEWGRAAFTSWTHTANGLTRNDFIIAAKIDQIAAA
jgi:4a-hydroxytetrahydrobiopterin dehydratase